MTSEFAGVTYITVTSQERAAEQQFMDWLGIVKNPAASWDLAFQSRLNQFLVTILQTMNLFTAAAWEEAKGLQSEPAGCVARALATISEPWQVCVDRSLFWQTSEPDTTNGGLGFRYGFVSRGINGINGWWALDGQQLTAFLDYVDLLGCGTAPQKEIDRWLREAAGPGTSVEEVARFIYGQEIAFNNSVSMEVPVDLMA